MAYRDIVVDGNPILRKICREVTEFDEKLANLLSDMAETLKRAEGLGLAAPQVGILKRIAIVGVDEFFVELINPVITACEGEQIGPEGCLSVPNMKQCDVSRPNKVTVKYFDRTGKECSVEVEGLVARACAHEIDHLDGILFYDKIVKKVYRKVSPKKDDIMQNKTLSKKADTIS